MNKNFENFLTKNLTFKLISIALALFLWFFVTFRGQTDTVIDVPLEFKNTPSEMEILKQSVKKINTCNFGKRKNFKRISTK